MLDSWFFLRTDSWALPKLTKSESLVWSSEAQECVSPQRLAAASLFAVTKGSAMVWIQFECGSCAGSLVSSFPVI